MYRFYRKLTIHGHFSIQSIHFCFQNNLDTKQKCLGYIEKKIMFGNFSIKFIHFSLDTALFGVHF